MTNTRRYLPLLALLLSLGAVTTSFAAAETKAVQTMAGILVKLNHFPSDAEKASLKAIVEDKTTTASEKVVAEALMNLQHKVTAGDKTKLDELLKDKAATESVKTLATILVGLNHMPAEADKEKLKKLAA